ncbi:MAG: phage tail protein [Snodgrassella sp.]|uniref:phage baseplate assembly protein n=1 Tax=Snodgrassella sp. TaxID=2815304 RepID=UPI002588CAE8|nr:phage tail protein [Snodgrassella sp.]MCO6514490.1 phage tail protein [Snodgrassella sp.]MCO6520913.1 phage tail protein [Snodgrassella sp.]
MSNNDNRLPYPYGNKVTVRVGGKEHQDWLSYDIDSDFLIPADAFNFETNLAKNQPKLADYSSLQCEVLINDQLVMTGIIGRQRESVYKGDRSINFAGRDLAGLLVDCSVAQINYQGMTILAAAKKIAAPWPAIKNVVLKAEKNPVLTKIDIEPGTTAWQTLIKLANSVGLHAWMEPDGILIVGGADYTSPPVATLCHSRTDNRRNLQSIEIEYNTENRYSEVTFLGQSHTKHGDKSKHDLKWVYKDPTMTLHKPRTEVIHDAENLEQLQKHAKKKLADWRLEGFTLTITVPDHKTQDGTLWTPGQRVHVIDEEQGIDAIFFLMGRRFMLNRYSGSCTELRLKEDGVWIPDAYNEKSKRARGRKGKRKGVTDRDKKRRGRKRKSKPTDLAVL